MRKRLVLLPLLAGFASACVVVSSTPSSAWADDARKDYALKDFDKIDASAGVEVILSQGPWSVKAEAHDADMSRLKLYTQGDTLVISRESTWFGGNRRGSHYTVTVSAPNYRSVEASSGSSVDGKGLSLKNLEVEVSSGADVDLAGACSDLRVSVSSGANFDGGDLKCETASVDASSGASADAFASNKANGDASSGADITFHGRPASIEKDTSSGGSVRAL